MVIYHRLATKTLHGLRPNPLHIELQMIAHLALQCCLKISGRSNVVDAHVRINDPQLNYMSLQSKIVVRSSATQNLERPQTITVVPATTKNSKILTSQKC
jgi:hypothetical protein